MIRDPERLRIFREADELAFETYQITADMPMTERYGLQSQIRRAAVSVPCNIVEGTSRHGAADYSRFFEIARGSARETWYLLDLSRRLGLVERNHSQQLVKRYAGLQAAIRKFAQTVGKP